jgi:RNA polymerase sigma-70 factor (ECF subfamily)
MIQQAEKATASFNAQAVELVKDAANGDVEAFGQLYDLYLDKIFRYVYYHVPERMAAEDISQEVFVRAWKAIKSCRGREGTFLAWLYRIAHNLMVDHHRCQRKCSSLETQCRSTMTNQAETTELDLREVELTKALRCLPEEHKNIIILKFIEGFSNQEIGQILNKSQGAIRITQMRALSRLRKHLTKSREREDGT